MSYNTHYTKASQMFDNDDFHAWIETPEGKILDYSNNDPVYKQTRRIHKLTKKRVYKAFPDEEERKAFTHLDKKHIKPRMELLKKLSKDLQEKICERWMNSAGHCIMRAYLILEKNPTYKIRIGSMGWKNKRGKVWWEYG